MQLSADQAAAAEAVPDWHMLHHKLEYLLWEGRKTRHVEDEGKLLLSSAQSDWT
jgi:hypothetical protein